MYVVQYNSATSDKISYANILQTAGWLIKWFFSKGLHKVPPLSDCYLI